MKAKALRLPDKLLNAVKFAERKERLDEPTTLRKFLRLGAEKYVGDSYARGDIIRASIERFVAPAIRLYEQEQGEFFCSPLLGLYVNRWVRCLYSGITLRTKQANAVP